MKYPVILLGLLLVASPAAAVDIKPIKVVASFTVLADIAKNIGGKDVEVTSLVGPNGDVHEYEPTPDDAKKLFNADVILVNGLGLEGWMTRLIQASGAKARIYIVTDGLKPRIMYAVNGTPDPHAWQNATNGRMYARYIANILEAMVPKTIALQMESREKGLDALLTSIDLTIRNQVKRIPEAQRKIITSHDAFGYFGAAYGIKFLAPEGVNPVYEPSAADIARLIEQMKALHVKTVFFENMSNRKLIDQIAKDSGAKVGGEVYSDALSPPDGEASNYPEMLHHNMKLFLAAMADNKP